MSEDNKDITILAIESSCDETSAAVLRNTRVLSNYIAGQKVHEKYGGVVPELASRAHMQNILPVVDAAIKDAGISKSDLDAIAYTRGPGLMGALLVGVSFAKSMAQALDIPLIEVNHMRAHVLAHFLDNNAENYVPPTCPFLCLTISGGHTQIVYVKSPLDMEVIGSTIDDAAGEAFDKSAKLLGLPYPGGPMIDKLAKEGNSGAYNFPKPKVDDYDYSFSGFKTSVLRFVEKNPEAVKNNLPDICASIQSTLVDYLLEKFFEAAKDMGINQLAIAGGVSANSEVRAKLAKAGEKNNWKVFIPKFEFCTDNAAMIGASAYFQYQERDFGSLDANAIARLKL